MDYDLKNLGYMIQVASACRQKVNIYACGLHFPFDVQG